jgi:predicted double-glycine peptidase
MVIQEMDFYSMEPEEIMDEIYKNSKNTSYLDCDNIQNSNNKFSSRVLEENKENSSFNQHHFMGHRNERSRRFNPNP